MLDDQERLVVIAPLYLRTTRAHGLIPLRELRFLGSETVCSSYLDVIANEKQKRAVLQGLYCYLSNEARGDWDVLTLSEVPAESSTIDMWNELFDEAGKVGEIVSTTCCPVIRLPGDVDTYRAGLGRSRRYTLQRKMKCLQGGRTDRVLPCHEPCRSRYSTRLVDHLASTPMEHRFERRRVCK